MDVQEEPEMLKRGAQRSVRRLLEAGEPAVGKRWEARGAWQGLRARARARREFELLGRLQQAGLPVPRPLALRESDGRPELVCAFIEGRTLREVLAAGAPRDLAERLGRELARAHAAGLRHEDLHAGNVLVDARGAPWLVDLGGARLGAPLSPAERAGSLVLVAADLREATSPSWRARALAAYRAEAGAEAAGLDARTLEARAQERRRDVIARAQRRWLRDSSSCVKRAHADGIELAARRGAAPDERVVVLAADSPARARRLWLAAVRLCDHALPCARPLAWRGTELRFALPAAARPCALEPALAGLEARLADRGLELVPGPGLRAFRDGAGEPWILGAEELRERAGRAPWRSR